MRKPDEEERRRQKYQAGLTSISSSIQHFIGNTVNKIYGHSVQIERDAGELPEVAELLRKIADEADASERIKQKPSAEPVKLNSFLEEAARALDRIANERLLPAAEHLVSGSESIIDIIRIQQNLANGDVRAVIFELEEMIREVVSPYCDQGGNTPIDVRVNAETGPGHVTLPKDLLQQALRGLTKNCREAIRIRMETANFEGKIMISSAELDGNRFSLSLSDNGCGLASEELENAIQFGYTGRKDLTGIRLQIAANFVQSLGGTISLHSRGKNRGAEVRMTLPVQV